MIGSWSKSNAACASTVPNWDSADSSGVVIHNRVLGMLASLLYMMLASLLQYERVFNTQSLCVPASRHVGAVRWSLLQSPQPIIEASHMRVDRQAFLS